MHLGHPAGEGPPASWPVRLRAGAAHRMEVGLEQQPGLQVRVHRGGAPVPRAEVGALAAGDPFALARAVLTGEGATRTDRRGLATVVLPGPGSYVLFARTADRGPVACRTVDLAGGVRSVSMDLGGSTVRGDVWVRWAGPEPGAVVRLIPERFAGAIAPEVWVRTESADPALAALEGRVRVVPGEAVARAGADGSFVLRDVPAGDYELLVEAPDCAPLAGGRLSIPESSRQDVGLLQLEPLCELEGRIAWGTPGSETAPAVGVLELLDADSRPVTCRAVGEDGAFRFGGLAPGRYRLVLHVRGRAHAGQPFDLRHRARNEHTLALP